MPTNFDINTSEGSQNSAILGGVLSAVTVIAAMVASRYYKGSSKRKVNVAPAGVIVENIRAGNAVGRGVERALNRGPFTNAEIAARIHDRIRGGGGESPVPHGSATDVVGGVFRTTTFRSI